MQPLSFLLTALSSFVLRRSQQPILVLHQQLTKRSRDKTRWSAEFCWKLCCFFFFLKREVFLCLSSQSWWCVWLKYSSKLLLSNAPVWIWLQDLFSLKHFYKHSKLSSFRRERNIVLTILFHQLNFKLKFWLRLKLAVPSMWLTCICELHLRIVLLLKSRKETSFCRKKVFCEAWKMLVLF